MTSTLKKVGVTSRVTLINKYQERRDSLDQRWWPFIHALGFIPVPLPNLPAAEVKHLATALDLSAIILSSGNSLAVLDPNSEDVAPERDAFELSLIKWALQNNCPVVGVCRGMQIINHYFGGTLVPVAWHAATRHMINFCGDWKTQESREVNSYHDWGLFTDNLAQELQAVAQHEDGSIEALIHPHKKISGIMWHPEREESWSSADIELLKRLLQ